VVREQVWSWVWVREVGMVMGYVEVTVYRPDGLGIYRLRLK
jgi:hypothetical protein